MGPAVKLPVGNHGNSNSCLARKKKIKKAASCKLQAALTMDPGACRMNIERRIMEVEQLKRIADAIEEILRLVKKDMEPKKK